MTIVKLYITGLIFFLILDALWLGIVAKNFYAQELGYIMASEIRWGAALLFYLLYILGLTLFVTLPSWQSDSIAQSIMFGAFFGLVCYATYDLTNLATIKDFPLKVVVFDMIWGAFVTGATSALTVYLALSWRSFFR